LLEASQKFEETTRRFEASNSSANAGSPNKAVCEAKVKKRLLSRNELWAHLEHWNNFHVCRLLKGLHPQHHRDALFQVAQFCFDLADKV
jgi:hypothetical protein